MEQTQVKKGEGFCGDCWTVGVLHAQQRWLFDFLCGFSIDITWTDFLFILQDQFFPFRFSIPLKLFEDCYLIMIFVLVLVEWNHEGKQI